MIKEDDRLKMRLYRTTYYDPNGIETVKDVCRDLIGIVSEMAVRNHLKKHQQMGLTMRRQLAERVIKERSKNPMIVREAAKERALEIIKEEGEILAEGFRPTDNGDPQYIHLWDAFLKLGLERVMNGTVRIESSHILKAAADMAAYDDKKKDRQVELIKSIASFAAPQQPKDEEDNAPTRDS